MMTKKDELELADKLITQHADADMSGRELYELFVANDISKPTAELVASCMRPGEKIKR
jgi:hypothetical protein